MRKNIALMLALVMLFTMIAPMSASAASSNRVTNVLTMEEDGFTSAGNTFLVISDDDGDIGTDKQRIQLNLDNAEWKLEADGTTSGDIEQAMVAATGYSGGGDGTATYTYQTATRMEVTFELNAAANGIRIPILAQVGDEGDATISINRLQSAVSRSTDLVFATVIDGDTVTTVDGTVTFGPEEEVKLEPIIIDETTEDALKLGDTVEFKLPRDFEWVQKDNITVTATGGISGGSVTTPATDAAFNFNGRDLSFNFNEAFGLTTASNNQTGTIIIEGLYITSDSSRFGEVNLTVDGALTEQTFKIADYADYGIAVEVDGDLEEVIAGQWEEGRRFTTDADASANGEGFELPTLVMEEKVFDSWVEGRKVTIEFPDWIKIVDVSVELDNIEETGSLAIDSEPMDNSWYGDNEFEFTPSRDADDEEMEIEIDFTVIAEAGSEGDIEAVITGRGLDDDYSVVLGSVISPISVDMDMAEIVIGESAQAIGDITITENVVGALKDGEWLEITFDIDDLRIHSGYEVEVINEDESGLEIDDVERDGNVLRIEIDRESDDEEGVIVISGLQVSLARTPATADYDVIIGGAAVVNNVYSGTSEPDEWSLFDEFAAWEAPYLSVVTERTREVKSVDFVIGTPIEGLNVAPFIQDGRTMVPLRAMEDLLDTELRWNPVSRTVSFRYNDDAYVVAIGEQMIKMNGADWHEMDTVAIISQDRTYLPASQIADALGDVTYSWDEVTRTATFTR